jgi:hypothetical protein
MQVKKGIGTNRQSSWPLPQGGKDFRYPAGTCMEVNPSRCHDTWSFLGVGTQLCSPVSSLVTPDSRVFLANNGSEDSSIWEGKLQGSPHHLEIRSWNLPLVHSFRSWSESLPLSYLSCLPHLQWRPCLRFDAPACINLQHDTGAIFSLPLWAVSFRHQSIFAHAISRVEALLLTTTEASKRSNNQITLHLSFYARHIVHERLWLSPTPSKRRRT